MALPAAAQIIADDIDGLVNTFLTAINSKQAEKILGRFYQLLPIGDIPIDGAVVVADKLTDTPTDRSESWSSLGFIANQVNNLKCSVRVNEYLTADNQRGYVVVLEFISEGITHRRAINFGPETYLEYDWV